MIPEQELAAIEDGEKFHIKNPRRRSDIPGHERILRLVFAYREAFTLLDRAKDYLPHADALEDLRAEIDEFFWEGGER